MSTTASAARVCPVLHHPDDAVRKAEEGGGAELEKLVCAGVSPEGVEVIGALLAPREA